MKINRKNLAFFLGFHHIALNTPAMPLPLVHAHFGGFFYARTEDSGMTAFNKPPLSVTQQLDLWAKRGLSIPDPTRARRYLMVTSYGAHAYLKAELPFHVFGRVALRSAAPLLL